MSLFSSLERASFLCPIQSKISKGEQKEREENGGGKGAKGHQQRQSYLLRQEAIWRLQLLDAAAPAFPYITQQLPMGCGAGQGKRRGMEAIKMIKKAE